MARSHSDVLRPILGGLLAFIGLGAVGGGVFGIIGAEGVPTEWLRGTPFRSYFIPSLILLFGVAGSSLAAAMLVFRAHRFARIGALGAGAILLTWMAVQLAIIGYVSWLQPTFVVFGLLVLSLAGVLRPTD